MSYVACVTGTRLLFMFALTVRVLALVAPTVVLPLNVLIPVTLNVPLAVKLVVFRFVAAMVVTYRLAQVNRAEPKLYVLSTLGKILLETSALKVTVSCVTLLPNVILPSAVITPVACKLPVINVLLFNLICPVPNAVKLISSLVTVLDTVFPVMFKLPTLILPW